MQARITYIHRANYPKSTNKLLLRENPVTLQARESQKAQIEFQNGKYLIKHS
jgi:hypothetical protein